MKGFSILGIYSTGIIICFSILTTVSFDFIQGCLFLMRHFLVDYKESDLVAVLATVKNSGFALRGVLPTVSCRMPRLPSKAGTAAGLLRSVFVFFLFCFFRRPR